MEFSMTSYSVIVPVYNEVDSLRPLYERLEKTLSDTGEEFEIIFIDDGSSDGSLEILENIFAADSRAKYISFAVNNGKSAVYSTGFQYSSGNIIITIDADLQDHPEEIPVLIKKLEQYDLVIGRKSGRLKNEPLKSIPSKFFNFVKRILFGLTIHDSNCGLKAMKWEVAERLNLYGDLYRFIAELAYSAGFKITEVPVKHSSRLHGKSKYGIGRFNTGLMDILTVKFLISFSAKPLHFFGRYGFDSADSRGWIGNIRFGHEAYRIELQYPPCSDYCRGYAGNCRCPAFLCRLAWRDVCAV